MKKLILIITSIALGFFMAFTPNTVYAQIETKIIASDGAAADGFGWPVSISRDYVVVGACGDDDGKGSAYIFRRGETSWSEEAKLTASDGAAEDYFGWSVSISGNYVVIGAVGDDNYTGSVYIFKRDGTSWSEVAKLTASDGATHDGFGGSVFISGDYVVVGAPGDDYSTGSVYIFKRDGTSWSEEAKLTASDGAKGFGCSVSVSGNYLIIGTDGDSFLTGSAYIFKRDGTNWSEVAKLTASDGAEGDGFGGSVSISGDYVVVGAETDDDATGSAYIFKRDGTSWSEMAKLFASDGTVGDRFGSSVSISGDYVVVGAEGDDDNGSNSGSAYIFRRGGETSWSEVAKLTASDGAADDYFGGPVSINGDYVAVGACGDDNNNGEDSGSAYLYELKFKPTVLHIQDVPNDQGGRVTVKWQASSLDNDIETLPFYSIWRALPEGRLSKASPISPENITKDFTGTAYRFASLNGTDYAWEWLANQPAHGFTEYTYTAATLYDSMSTTDGKHYFLVSAHTNDPNIFYDSNVDSGYSVDNLPPLPPTGLIASVVENTVELNWNESPEADLRFYVIYRDGSRYDSTSQTQYVDASVEIGQSYSYKLTAVDVHENESEFSEEVSSGPVPVELVSFTASVNSLTVTLNWETATETNNFGFAIERRAESNNEGVWQEIGFVKGHGTTSVPHTYTFTDNLENSIELSNSPIILRYRLKQVDFDGTFEYSQEVEVTIRPQPITFKLSQNYPNPFNPSTVICFSLPKSRFVTLKVYDLVGQEIETLVRGQRPAGEYEVKWTAKGLPSGIYFYRLEAGEFAETKKFILQK